MSTSKVSVRLTDEQITAISWLAASEDRTFSAMLRRLLSQSLTARPDAPIDR